MFEVVIGSKKYGRQEVESVSFYSDGDKELYAWVSFNKDVSELVGLSISISSRNGEDFVGRIDSVEEINEHICKLYCVGSSSSSNESRIDAEISSPKKQVEKRTPRSKDRV